MQDYTLFLNYFNKPVDLLEKQLNSILGQTQQPAYVIACFLGTPDGELLEYYKKFIVEHKLEKTWNWVDSSYDFKYIGRYQLAINAPTDMVIVLDDDRLPLPRAFQNMVETSYLTDSIINQYGWKLELNKDGEWEDQVGEFLTINLLKDEEFKKKVINEKLLLHPVDYLCGGMVFNKKHLKVLFNEPVMTITTGEDIIFCLKARLAGIGVYMYMPGILDEYMQDTIEAKHGDVSSTLWGKNVDQIHKIRTLLIKQYKEFKNYIP